MGYFCINLSKNHVNGKMINWSIFVKNTPSYSYFSYNQFSLRRNDLHRYIRYRQNRQDGLTLYLNGAGYHGLDYLNFRWYF